MPLLVADIVALPVIQRGQPEVIAGHGLNRPVRWVHVSDVADLTGLLQGGELVLTTGSALRDDPRDYLETMARAGAVGLVVEVGPDASLPADAGAVADRLGLALVVLRRVIRFVEVTEQVHRSIVADQYDEVEFARSTHEVFTELSMRRGSPTDIVEATAQLLGSPIVLEDLTHQAVAVATAGRRTVIVLRDWERRSRLQTAGVGPVGAEDWLATAVGRGGDEWGRLIAIDAPDSARTTMVLERAAQALVMFRMAERDRFDIERQAQAGLLDDILRERIRDEQEATARAFALGLTPADRYIPATVRLDDLPASADPVAAQRRRAHVLDTVVRAVRAAGHTGLFSIGDQGEIRMILSPSTAGDPTEVALRALADKIRRSVQRSGDARRVVLGTAESATELVDAVRRIAEAGQIAEAGLAMPGDGRSYFTVGDIRLRGLVAMLRTDPRAQRFAEAELRTLILHDLSSGDRLLDVLRAYLELAGNKSAVAARLHVSRPAMYAKLARIRQVLGVDLEDGESTTSLHVALLLLDARGAGAPPG